MAANRSGVKGDSKDPLRVSSECVRETASHALCLTSEKMALGSQVIFRK